MYIKNCDNHSILALIIRGGTASNIKVLNNLISFFVKKLIRYTVVKYKFLLYFEFIFLSVCSSVTTSPLPFYSAVARAPHPSSRNNPLGVKYWALLC